MNQNRDPQTERDLFREEPTPAEPVPAAPTGKKSWLLTLVFVLIAALTFWAVTSQIRDFSFSDFAGYIRNANPVWLIAAFLCMLAFILFEGVALLDIVRSFGYRKGPAQGFFWSAGKKVCKIGCRRRVRP